MQKKNHLCIEHKYCGVRNLIEYVSVEGKAIYFERIKVIQSLSDHNAYEGILNLPEIFFENLEKITVIFRTLVNSRVKLKGIEKD